MDFIEPIGLHCTMYFYITSFRFCLVFVLCVGKCNNRGLEKTFRKSYRSCSLWKKCWTWICIYLMNDEACSFIHPYLSSVCQYLSSLDLKHSKQLTVLGKIFVFWDLCCICRLCLLLVELSTSTSAAVDVTTPPPSTTTEAETSSSYADVGTTSSTLGSTESSLAGNYCQMLFF